MNIYYFTSHSVYKSGANSNRILCIAKGLVEMGHNVSIVHTAVIDTPEITFDSNLYGNVITFHTKNKQYSIYGRIVFALLSFIVSLKSYFWILHEIKRNTVYIISLDTLFLNKLIYFFLRFHRRAILVKEVLEYPLYEIEKLSTLKNIYYRFNYKLEYKIFNAFLPISSNLNSYLHKEIHNKIKTEIIPICVEIKRFSDIPVQSHFFQPYIAYCGDMSNDKDGLSILLDVFENIYRIHPEYSLILIGPGYGTYYNNLLNKRNLLLSKDNIHFIGKIERDEIPNYLKNAEVLVLTRPLMKQTQGGLPTKLGEYLATGKPVVVSDVSDIKAYLQPRNAAFIVKPGSVDDATVKILDAIENKQLSAAVGANGRKAAEELFSEIKVAEKIASFLLKIAQDV